MAARRSARRRWTASPNLILKMPGDTLAPFILALGLAVALRRRPAARLVARRVRRRWSCAGALVRWFWPRREHAATWRDRRWLRPSTTDAALPVAATRPQQRRLVGHAVPDRHRGVAVRLSAVQLLLLRRPARPAGSPEPHPSLALAGPNTLDPAARAASRSGGASRASSAGGAGQHLVGLGAGILLGVVFLAVQVFEWKAKSYSLSSGSYGSLFFTVTGFHMAHVVVGVLILAAVFAWSAAGYFRPRRHDAGADQPRSTGTSSTWSGCACSSPSTSRPYLVVTAVHRRRPAPRMHPLRTATRVIGAVRCWPASPPGRPRWIVQLVVDYGLAAAHAVPSDAPAPGRRRRRGRSSRPG